MQLLEHFKELTIHPKNAQELKGLILQLAIQGKLTQKWREQNPNVEPASVLLEKIKAEKEQLVKEKKIKKEKVLPEISEDEIPFVLPKTWEWIRLGTLTHNFGQKKPDNEFEYIDVASIDNSLGVINNSLNIIQAAEAPSRARKIIQKGCVIYSTVRPYLLNIAIINREFENEAIASTAFAILKPVAGYSELFLYHVLRSRFFIDYVESCMKGVAYPAINDSNLLSGIIPIPPLEEQRAIVATVNQLFKEVEELEAQTKERVKLKEDFVTSALKQLAEAKEANGEWAFLQQHFKSFFNTKDAVKKLRESILQLAVQGKLTSHWRLSHPLGGDAAGRGGIESASVLLEKIKAEKEQLIKEKKIKKEKPLPEITAEEIPYVLPDGWVWCRLGDVITLKSGQDLTPREYSDEQEIGLPYITGASHLQNEKVIIGRWTDNPKSIAYRGDLLFTCKGSGVGKMGWLHVKEAHIARQIMAVNTVITDLQFIKIKLDDNLSYIKSKANGLIPGIDRKTVLEMTFALPPFEEQKAIVAKVNSLMALCDQLEQEIEQNTQQVEDLMQSCLKEVFEEKKATKIIGATEVLGMVAEADTEYGKGIVVNFSERTCTSAERAILAAYILTYFSKKDIGRTQLMKLLHLVEYHCRVNIGSHFVKQTAGPYDRQLIDDIERYFNSFRLFRVAQEQTDRKKVHYVQITSSEEIHQIFNEKFSNENVRITHLLSKLKDWTLETCEIVSTIYAVWNNRVILNKEVSDEYLVRDFIEWSERKKNFKTRLKPAISWMKENKIVPTGYGDVIKKLK